MKKEIEKFLVENTPTVKKRGWILKLIWKTFHYFKTEDIFKIWEIYNSLKSIIINLTAENKKIKPYWNAKCVNLQSKIWLPKTKNSKNNFKETDYFWKKELKPKFQVKNLSTKVEKPKLKLGKLAIASKKIRFYPENEEKYFQALTLYRRAYNLAVSNYLNGTYKNEENKWKNLRPEIKAQCKKEQEENNSIYNSIIVDNAVLSAQTTFKVVLKNSKNKNYSKIRFKSRKGEIHSFSIDRMPKGLNPVVRQLGKIFLTEEVPKEAINKLATVTYNKGRWFIQVQQHIQTKTEIQGEVKTVAIDQGV